MQLRTKIITSIAAVIALGATGLAIAKDHGRGGPMGGMHSEAAIAACQNQSEGANIVFDHPMWGNVNAVCGKTPQDGKLMAMPPKMLAHIKLSQAACVGKAEGDKVTISSMHDSSKSMEATCKKRGDVLSAKPEGMGHDNKEMRDAKM